MLSDFDDICPNTTCCRISTKSSLPESSRRAPQVTLNRRIQGRRSFAAAARRDKDTASLVSRIRERAGVRPRPLKEPALDLSSRWPDCNDLQRKSWLRKKSGVVRPKPRDPPWRTATTATTAAAMRPPTTAPPSSSPRGRPCRPSASTASRTRRPSCFGRLPLPPPPAGTPTTTTTGTTITATTERRTASPPDPATRPSAGTAACCPQRGAVFRPPPALSCCSPGRHCQSSRCTARARPRASGRGKQRSAHSGACRTLGRGGGGRPSRRAIRSTPTA